MSNSTKNLITIIGGLALGLIGLALIFAVVGLPGTGPSDDLSDNLAVLDDLPAAERESFLEFVATFEEYAPFGHIVSITQVGGVWCVWVEFEGVILGLPADTTVTGNPCMSFVPTWEPSF